MTLRRKSNRNPVPKAEAKSLKEELEHAEREASKAATAFTVQKNYYDSISDLEEDKSLREKSRLKLEFAEREMKKTAKIAANLAKGT